MQNEKLTVKLYALWEQSLQGTHQSLNISFRVMPLDRNSYQFLSIPFMHRRLDSIFIVERGLECRNVNGPGQLCSKHLHIPAIVGIIGTLAREAPDEAQRPARQAMTIRADARPMMLLLKFDRGRHR